jgi:hypothetical protein
MGGNIFGGIYISNLFYLDDVRNRTDLSSNKRNARVTSNVPFTPKRIEVHVCICFVAYKVYKELERILKISGINLSVDKVLNIAKTITTLKIKMPVCGETFTKTMILTQKHKSIAKLFDQNFWKNF